MKKALMKFRIFALSAILLSALVPFVKVSADEVEQAKPIYSESGLYELVTHPEKSYILKSDIDLSSDFLPIAEFYGKLTGGGHTLRLHASGEYYDGFALIMENHGTITGLNVECDVDISAGSSAFIGGIAARNYGFIDDCAIFGKIKVEISGRDTSEYVYAGGVVGYSEEDVSNCVSHADVSLTGAGIMHAGGIAGGTFECVISNCFCDSVIFAEGSNAMAGGIAGECDGKTGYSSFSGTVTASGVSFDKKRSYAYAGGVVGYALDHVVECENIGVITAKGDALTSAYAGGGCGTIYGKVTRFINSGAIYVSAGSSIYAGGVSGRASEKISGASNVADIFASGSTADAFAGGIFGKGSECEDCTSQADIEASALHVNVGGICGECDTVKNCVSSGEIRCTAVETYVGGTAGNARYVSDCGSTCDLELFGRFCEIFAGGITAKAYTSVTASEFSGHITAETEGGYIYMGGVVAYNISNVLRCRATPSLSVRMETQDASGVIAIGCIVGGNYGRISECGGLAKIYANAILNTTVRGSGRMISIFAGNNAGLSRVSGNVSDSTAQSKINAYIISGGVAKPKINLD